MNITPNSFSDGGEIDSPQAFIRRLNSFGKIDALDVGAESTAPMNKAISWEEEWERFERVMPLLEDLDCALSVDTYHPETIFKFVKHWKDLKLESKLIWNDVSGKFDDAVREFLKTGFDYVFCHNLAPSRELTGKHMDFVVPELDLVSYFSSHKHPQVIFDPCLGFSKSYEQNWDVLKNFGELEKIHSRWLLGFSRKSFLRKKFQTEDREELDVLHANEVKRMKFTKEIWIRTHRPELL